MKTLPFLSRAALIVLVVLLSGCAAISGKTVANKVAPNILVAVDGSICSVSQKQWERTEVGMKALCMWKGGRVGGNPDPTKSQSKP